MFRNKAYPTRFIEATRLTRAGRLVEATALIQRTLRDRRSVPEDGDRRVPGGEAHPRNDAIEGEFLQVEESTNAPVKHAQTGQFLAASYANHAGSRGYKLYIPKRYTGQPLPLVVMLHGCTQTADDFAAGTRMNAIAEDRQCLVLYPEQTHGANHSRCWNWFKRSDQRRDRGEPAVLAGMTQEIISRYGSDQARVFIAGLSAGGAMAAVMAMTYPDLYAAVGIHSGLACGSAHDLNSALAAMRGTPTSVGGRSGAAPALAPARPTIVFHGDRDKTVHPRNGQDVVSQSIDQDRQLSAGASTERGEVPGGHAYTRTVYADPTGRAVLEHWLVHEGGHAWFGGSPRGSYVDPKGPDAAREMMRFFYQSVPEQ